MKTVLIAVVSSVCLVVGAYSALASTQPLFTSFAVPATTIPIAVSSSTSLYVEHDAPQQNTCYIVVAKSTVTGIAVSSSISCIADHIQSDFPTTTLPIRG